MIGNPHPKTSKNLSTHPLLLIYKLYLCYYLCIIRTVVFGEYQCRGKGANRRSRVSWSKSLNYREATPFLDVKFIHGEQWLRL